MTGRSPNDDTHELLGRADGLYHIKSTPKDAGSVEFAYYEIWIDAQTFLPTRTLQTGESTVATMSDVQYNIGLPEQIFSEASLRRAPRKYLR